MAKEGKKGRKKAQEEPELTADAEETEPDDAEEIDADAERPPLVSAKDIPGPGTNLAVPPRGSTGKLIVSLMGDTESVPDLGDVSKINEAAESEVRTPLMTVIEAVLGSKGGKLSLADLSKLAFQYWNRPLPTSPYTAEEFVYIMVLNSDNLRIDS